MSKKIVISLVAVATVVIILSSVVINKPEKNKDLVNANATVRILKDGATTIACEDALWLAEAFRKMTEEKVVQLEEYNLTANHDNITIEEARKAVYDNKTATQLLIERWDDDVIYALNNLYASAEERKRAVQEQIGSEYLAIYQAVTAVYMGELEQSELDKAIQSKFCGK